MLCDLAGKPIPDGSGKVFRLNWGGAGLSMATEHEHSLFVSDLDPAVT